MGVSKLSNFMIDWHYQQQFTIEEKTWPPGQPTTFIPQYFVYHQGDYKSKEESDLMVSLIETNDFHHNDLHYQPIKPTKATKDNITETLAILQKCKHHKFILIEGFSGMGKTILSKQIACIWAKTFKFVFLVNLQDPKVHQVKSLHDLLQYFCEEKSWPTGITEWNDHITESGGKDVAFLFDAFDKFPLTSQDESFIYKVIKHEVLLKCTVLVSSCPHASALLRHKASVRVYLLGFSEMEQKEFIEKTLKDQAQSQKIIEYLERDTMCTIRKFCSVPFNIAALLFLYNQKSHKLFTSDCLELYNHFTCLTICRHLAKHGYSLENKQYDLNNLPAPYNRIITQLGNLSIESLKSKKTTFTFADIKETCPDIVPTSESVNDLGLLQAVQHDCINGNTIEFNFDHLFQEFLAAHYIHVSDNQVDCVNLFNFFLERSKREICRLIANSKTFNDRTISLRDKKLLSSDVEHLTCFLTQSHHKEWEKVDLNRCGIKDEHISTLHQGLMSHRVSIKRLSLSKNEFTESSSSNIIDIAVHCKVEVLSVRFNHIPTIYKVLSNPHSVVKELYMSHTNFKECNTTTKLFSILEKDKKLRSLRISNNNITDDDCSAIVKALKNNTFLVELTMFHNSFGIENALKIVRALTHNNTLENLVLPWYKEKDQKRIAKVAKKIDGKRNCRLDLCCYHLSS